MPTLSASVFSDADGDSHQASKWRIRKTNGAYDDPNSYGTTIASQTTEHTLSAGDALTANMGYYWRVQYQDGTSDWSNWSIETTFTTRSNTAPYVPTGLVLDNVSDADLLPTLSASTFSDADDATDPDGEYHQATQWQITTNKGNYDDPTVS